MNPYLKYFFFAIIVGSVFACQPQQGEPVREADPEEYLPPGTQPAAYSYNFPDSGEFQGARIHPPFWWTNMARDSVQLLIYDEDIKGCEVRIARSGIEVLSVDTVENSNYLFATIRIERNSVPGRLPIILTKNGETFRTYNYELKRRLSLPGRIYPLSANDLMYLIMPDRFANGDPSNDSFEDMRQSGVDRSMLYYRHGGDLQGVIDHLDYLKDIGTTAIWLTPVFENDQPYSSYHGYAITDHYAVDPRLGDIDKYLELSTRCQSDGIKLIKDIVFNHVGHKHWFILDLPDRNWIHQSANYKGSNHASASVMDPYSSSFDYQSLKEGWFDRSMPDLNQKHRLLAEYLIQMAIWWIEYTGIDGYRFDTHPFCDAAFMDNLMNRIHEEYPEFYAFGETWVQDIPIQAGFVTGSAVSSKRTLLPGVTDFQLNFAFHDALGAGDRSKADANKLYHTLTNDFIYRDPANQLVTFLDNHDMTRIFSRLGEDHQKLKSAISLLLTMRGIPCVYYGTELAFAGIASPDGYVRQDFPGGWPADTVNKFNPAGRTPLEQDVFAHFRKVGQFRKFSRALKNGETRHFAPAHDTGVYTYFRTEGLERIMVVYNPNDRDVRIPVEPYGEMIGNVRAGTNVLTDELVFLRDSINVAAGSTLIVDIDLN